MIEVKGKYYKCYLMDTNFILDVLKDKEGFGSKVFNIVLADGIFVFAATTIWEISQDSVFDDFIEVFSVLPSLMFISEEDIISEEIEVYHSGASLDISAVTVPFNKSYFFNGGLDLKELVKSKIPPAAGVRYKKSEEKAFIEIAGRDTVAYLKEKKLTDRKAIKSSVELLAYEFIAKSNFSFAKAIREESESLDVWRFPSVLSKSFIYHYKFANFRRKGEPSDLSDILVSVTLPYVDVFFTERSVANNIREIRGLYKFYKGLKTKVMR